MGNPGTPQLETREYAPAGKWNSVCIPIGAPVPADFPVRQAHRFHITSAFCENCGMPRTAALDCNSVYCEPADIGRHLDRLNDHLCAEGFNEKMFEDACERLVGELVRLPNGMIGSRRELNAYFDDFKARHRAVKRQANGDRLAAPAIALMERQSTALAAAFAMPVAPTIETLSASPPAAKLLPDS